MRSKRLLDQPGEGLEPQRFPPPLSQDKPPKTGSPMHTEGGLLAGSGRAPHILRGLQCLGALSRIGKQPLSQRGPSETEVTGFLELTTFCPKKLRRNPQTRRAQRVWEAVEAGAERARKVNLAQSTHQSGAAVACGAGVAFFSTLPSPRLISGYSAAL